MKLLVWTLCYTTEEHTDNDCYYGRIMRGKPCSANLMLVTSVDTNDYVDTYTVV